MTTTAFHSSAATRKPEQSGILIDPRDRAPFRFMAFSQVIIPIAGLMFWAGHFSWWIAPVYWAVWFVFFLPRFTTAFHLFHHRAFFTKRYKFVQTYVANVLAMFFGQTPGTFYVHHIAMHHAEGNRPGDLSFPMKYQRDNALHYLRYLLRFLVFGIYDLSLYFYRKRNFRLVRKLWVGEIFYYAMCAALAMWRFQPTLIVFIVPLFLCRTVMMCANWAQHAFVDPDMPADPFKSGAMCIEPVHNKATYNEGFHILHHMKPTIHYSELQSHWEQNPKWYGERDMIVFDKIDFVVVWFLLMTKNYELLAKCFVRLPGAPARTHEEVVAFLRNRVTPITTEKFAQATREFRLQRSRASAAV
jgi:fatty acid desaturase